MGKDNRDEDQGKLHEIAVEALVHDERHWRDRSKWDLMAQAYDSDSWVKFAWFEGTGSQLVEASMAGARGLTTKHRMSPSIVAVAGDRAVAETSALVETRTEHHGVAVDLTVSCRYLTLLRRSDDTWRITDVETICESDRMTPVIPGDVLDLDRQELCTYRASYMFLSCNLAALGVEPPADLPGDDRPDLTAPLYLRADKWLQNS